MKQDAIRDLIGRLIAAAAQEGGLTEQIAIQVELEFRQDYARTEIYVACPRNPHCKPDLAKQKYLQGQDIGEITRETGVSRRTLYRLLKR